MAQLGAHMGREMAKRSVREVCEACFNAHQNDCSGFAKVVASELGVPLHGLADEIVDTLRTGPGWTPLLDGVAAAKSAHDGKLVLAGLKGSEQAHARADRDASSW